jgi:hypothetical protein
MRGFNYRLTDAGNVTFGAGDGGKDDVVYATAWALWDLRQRKHQGFRDGELDYEEAFAVGSIRDELDDWPQRDRFTRF